MFCPNERVMRSKVDLKPFRSFHFYQKCNFKLNLEMCIASKLDIDKKGVAVEIVVNAMTECLMQ